MTSLFISHASVDTPAAQRVANRLREAGFLALFLDVDPEAGLRAGEDWERAIYSALRRSDGLVFLLSDASARSRWCIAELALARSVGKPVFPARVGGTARPPLVAEVQEVDLTEGDEGFTRLTADLRRAGLDPDDAFNWNPQRPPYPGLESFAAEDAAVYFGRDLEIKQLLELLAPRPGRQAGRWIGIVGPSGSGKSSLLRAGLLPRLARIPDRWVVLPPMTPGARPVARLASSVSRGSARHGLTVDLADLERRLGDPEAGPAALLAALAALRDVTHRDAAAPPQLLVPLDQAEELCTAPEADDQRAFVRLLRAALAEDPGLLVVSTLRAEFLDPTPDRPGLGTALDATLFLEPLPRARLPEVILRPAQRADLRFEAGLVERIVEEAAGGGDGLPLLAYTLHELADRVGGDRVVTAADYDAIGGVIGGLRNRADDILARLTADGHGPAVLPTLLLLVDVDERGVPVRRPLRLDALSPEQRAVIDAFCNARLLVTGVPDGGEGGAGSATVEVAHEALLRQWEPLRAAIARSSAALRLRADLARAVAAWEAGRRNPAYLLRGTRLEEVGEWLDGHEADADADMLTFVDACRALAADELTTARRRARRFRALAVGLAIFSALTLVAGGLAIQARSVAQEQASLALGRQLLAQAALVQADQPDLTLLLRVEAVRRSTGTARADARDALLDGLNRTFHVSTPFIGHEGGVDDVVYSRDGATVASAGADGTVRLWDATTGQPRGAPMTGHPGPVRKVVFSPDDRTVAAVSGSVTRLWDVGTGTLRGELTGHTGLVTTAVFTPDSATVATAGADGTVRLWDVASATARGAPLTGHRAVVFALAVSPNGDTLASGSWDTTTRLWDVATGAPLQEWGGHTNTVTAVAFSPDGATLAVASSDTTVALRDMASGREVGVLRGHTASVTTLAFSRNGAVLVTGGNDKTVQVWETAGWQPRGAPLTGHTDIVRDVVVTPDASTAVSSGNDGRLRLWDVAGHRALDEPLAGHTSWVGGLALRPDGSAVASASGDGTVRTWQLAPTAGQPGRVLPGKQGHAVTAVAFDRSGGLAVGDAGGTVQIWDPATGRVTATAVGHVGAVRTLAFRPSGTLASGGDDGTVRLWDPATGTPIGVPWRGGGAVLDVDFSRDGALLAAGGSDGAIRLWDAPAGAGWSERPRRELTGHFDAVNAVAFGDGLLASASTDHTVRLWDVATGRPVEAPPPADIDVRAVAFRPDGAVLASAGGDPVVRQWEMPDARPRDVRIAGFTQWINAVAFDAAGTTVATAADNGVWLWDADTGRRRGGSLGRAEEAVTDLAFAPEGDMLAFVAGGAARVVDLREDVLVRAACGIAHRRLSSAEAATYLADQPDPGTWCP